MVAYLGLLLIVVGALLTLERRDARDARRSNASLRVLHDQLCRSFVIVRDNQRLVLGTLKLWSETFSDRTKAGLKPVPVGTIRTIDRRLALLERNATCRP